MDLDPSAMLLAEPPALFGEGAAHDPIAEILDEAAAMGASHVHFDPEGETMRVRLRVGGRLTDVLRLPRSVDLGLAERGLPLAAMGERTVLHLAPRDTRCLLLEALGMTPGLARALGGITGGLVLVAGPMGSGRGTTLKTLLEQQDDGTRNLMTARDATDLRAVLRQDPDAILIESVADREMTALAMQAAEAGHLVLAGVDATDAVGAILKLRSLRADPFQLASTLKAVVAQRIVKRLCRACRQPVQAQGSVSALLGFDAGTVVYAPVGCEACDGGFTGRTAAFEAIQVDAALRRLINDNGDGAIIARHAFLNSPNLGSAARALVREGVTTPEEAVRISRN